jgi:hypothetical protein
MLVLVGDVPISRAMVAHSPKSATQGRPHLMVRGHAVQNTQSARVLRGQTTAQTDRLQNEGLFYRSACGNYTHPMLVGPAPICLLS